MRRSRFLGTALAGGVLLSGGLAGAAVVSCSEPFLDRWNYANNATPGYRAKGSLFTGLPGEVGSGTDRLAQVVLGFDTAAEGVPTGFELQDYRVSRVRVTARVANDAESLGDPELIYDPTPDLAAWSLPGGVDEDAGHPVELHGVGFRNGVTALSYVEGAPPAGLGQPGTPGTAHAGAEGQTAHVLGFDALCGARDVTNNVSEGFESAPWAVGMTGEVVPGEAIPVDTVLEFDLDLEQPGVRRYVQESLAQGRLFFSLSSLQVAAFDGGGGGGGEFAIFYMKESVEHQFFGDSAATVEIEVEVQPGERVAAKIVRGTGGVALEWEGEVGERFTILATGNLSDWEEVGEVEASSAGVQQHAVETGEAMRRFFEVRKRLD